MLLVDGFGFWARSMDVENEGSGGIQNSKRKLDKTVLDNFSNLLKPHDGTRIKSSINLLKYLSENDSVKVSVHLPFLISKEL